MSDKTDIAKSELVRLQGQGRRGRQKEGQRRKVLTEEEYTDNLSKIITRDYYPSLPSLHRDSAVLQKRSEGDIAGAVAIRRCARKIENDEEIRQQNEMEEERIARTKNGGIRKRPRPLDRESVDGFHARVTSEDNADFEVNMKQEARQKRHEMDIVYNTTGVDYKNVKNLLLQNGGDGDMTDTTDTAAMMQKQKRLLAASPLMASDEFTAPVERIRAAGTTHDGKNICDRNSLFFPPSGLDTNVDNKPQNQDQVLLLKNEGINDMPPPSKNPLVTQNSLPIHHQQSLEMESNKKAIEVRSKMKIAQAMHLVEYQAKSTLDTNVKQIIPSNTRFEFQRESRIVPSLTAGGAQTVEDALTIQPASSTGNSNKNALTHETDYSTTTDLDASPLSLSGERRARRRKVEEERNTFVNMTPLILPGDGGRGGDDDSPIITWGEVSSTPLVSGGEKIRDVEMMSKPFELPGDDEKRNIARKAESMLAKRGKQFREAGKLQSDNIKRKSTEERTSLSSRRKSSSSSATSDRIQSLTPAARRLLERSTPSIAGMGLNSSLKTSSKPSARSSSSFGSALRTSYTPKARKGSSQRSRNRSSKQNDVYKSTPLISSNSGHPVIERKAPSNNFAVDQKDSATGGLLKM